MGLGALRLSFPIRTARLSCIKVVSGTGSRGGAGSRRRRVYQQTSRALRSPCYWILTLGLLRSPVLCSRRHGRKRTWLSANDGLTKVTKLDQRRSRDDAASSLAAGRWRASPPSSAGRVAGSGYLEKRGSDVAVTSRGGSTRRWRKLRAFVLRRDGGRCQRCGSGGGKLEVHHIIPRTASGLDTPSNCRTLCVANATTRCTVAR